MNKKWIIYCPNIREHLRLYIVGLIKKISSYKDLLLVFIWREFTIRYRQSIFGILWAILQPLSMMLLFTFLFTVVIKHKVSDYPYVLFFYSGILPWSFFSSALNFAITSLVNHRDLITKIYFPREIIPIAGVAVSFIDFCIASIVYIFLLSAYKITITPTIFIVFPLLFLLFMFTVSVSLLFAALNVYFRDVKLVSGFLLQLWFFATPVFYSVDNISIKWKIILFLNPLTFITEGFRRVTLEARGVVWWQFLFELVIISIFYNLCYWVFNKIERKMADVI